MKTSVIIPTLNRQEDLKNALQSIVESSVLPDEIIIVEQGNLEKTKLIVQQFSNKLSTKLLFSRVQSGALARNLAIKTASGNILFFFDDDIAIEKDYIKNAIVFLKNKPSAMGITGLQTNAYTNRYTVARFFSLLFNITSIINANVITKSGQHSPISYRTQKVTPVEWLQGFNMVIRRKIFDDGIKFQKNFYKWSAGEDVFLSYQIYKKYTNSLFYVPSLRVAHFQSTISRDTNEVLIRMKILYKFIFWQQEVYTGTLFGLFIYVWSQIGIVAIELRNSLSLKPLIIAYTTYQYILKNYQDIKNKTIDFNLFVFKNEKYK